MNTTSTFLRPGIDSAAFGAFLEEVHESRNGRRRTELCDWALETGRQLPMSPEAIMTFEDAGAVVALESGRITFPNGIMVWVEMEANTTDEA